MDLEVEIEPPGLPEVDDDDGEPYTAIHVLVQEADGTRRAAYGGVPGQASDEDVADSLIAALRGAAAARGPGLSAAVARRLGEAAT